MEVRKFDKPMNISNSFAQISDFVHKNFYIKHKKDLFFVSLLTVLFIITACIMGHIYGDVFIDCGRELLLPQLLLEKKLLFKDIFAMYNPLSYQINAILYFLFGASINTLYFAGYLNALLLILGFYFICRLFSTEYFSFSFSFFIMGVYIYRCTSQVNYIFPYSFAMIYAATFFTYSVLLFLLFIKNDNDKFAYISCLLLGLSLANKPEFVLTIIPIILTLIIKKVSLKTHLFSIVLFIFPIVFSYGIMFIQGFTIEDLKNYVQFTKSFFNTYEQIHYTTNYIAPNWSLETLYIMCMGLISFAYFLLCSCVYFYIYTIKKFYFWIILPVYIVFSYNFLLKANISIFFSWTIIGSVIILFLLLKNINDKKHYMLFFLVISAIFSCARQNYMILGNGYFLYFLFPLLAIYLYIINFIPDFKKIPDIKKYVSAALLILSIFCIYQTKNRTKYYLPLKTNKGTIRSIPARINSMNYIINWINNNTKPHDSVLILPEGPFANFITDRPTKTLYYHLAPNHVSALGELNIINGLSKDKPKYIIIGDVGAYFPYGKDIMCNDWAHGICKFIEKNYKKVDEVSNKNYSVPMQLYYGYSKTQNAIIPVQIYENISDL